MSLVFTFGLIVFGIVHIYKSFTKFDYKFNTFLKTFHVKKRKISFNHIDSIQYAPAKVASHLLINETYDFIAFLVLKSGERFLLMEDKKMKELVAASKFIASECNIEFSMLKNEFWNYFIKREGFLLAQNRYIKY